MINAGLPLVQALDILAKQSDNKALQQVTRAVVFDVESGATVSDALGATRRCSPTCTPTWWRPARRAASSTPS
jgi:type II secretory pathway component PulF